MSTYSCALDTISVDGLRVGRRRLFFFCFMKKRAKKKRGQYTLTQITLTRLGWLPDYLISISHSLAHWAHIMCKIERTYTAYTHGGAVPRFTCGLPRLLKKEKEKKNELKRANFS